MFKNSSFFLCVLVQVFLVLGIAKEGIAQSDFVESGFISDYSTLSADPERPGVRLYIAPGADLDEYDNVLLTDVVVFLHPQSEYKGISPRKLGAVAQEFQTNMENRLQQKRKLVTEVMPGEPTVVVRLAISNVFAIKPSRSAVHYTPIGLASTGVKKATGRDYALSTAAFEAELLDGETGKVLAALVATQLGETLAKVKTGERKWSDIQAYLRDYADTLQSRFD